VITEPSSNKIFSQRFWLGEIDARIPAVFRVALGAILLFDVLDRLRDLFSFFTDLGIVPRAVVSAGPLRWSIFALAGTPTPTAALFLLGVPIAVALIVGYQTRVASVLGWVYVNSLMNRNPFVCDGGDAVLRLLLFWSMFADLGARFSLDCRLGRRTAQATVPALAIRCLQLQIAFIYLFTFFAKSGVYWRDGSAVLRVLENPQWSRGIGPFLARSPLVCKALTRGTQLVEATFALLVFSPWRPRLTRAVAICGGVALHVGIFLTIRVGLFSLIMPVSYLVYLAPEWIDRAEYWLCGELFIAPAPPGEPGAWTARFRRVGFALLALTFVPALLVQVVRVGSSRPLPRPLAQWIAFFSLEQNWKMFAPDPPKFDFRWTGPGVLSDGRPIDVVSTVAPGLGRPVGFIYNRWHKLGNNLIGQTPLLMSGVGSYLCRRYNGDFPGPKLAHFELALIVTPVPATSTPAPAPVSVFRQSCFAAESSPSE
jgi:hypothetical protein